MAGPPVTPDELIQVLAQEVDESMRVAARLADTKAYKLFDESERTWTYMLQEGWIDEDLYKLALENLFSFKYHIPAETAAGAVKALGEEKNPTPRLIMLSRNAGAKRIGDKVVPISKTDVPGMDSRSVEEVMRTPLAQQELSFASALEIMEILAAKKVAEGEADDQETQEFIETARRFKRQLARLVPLQDG